MKITNEYARLAQAKPMAARSFAEMIAACYGFDEENSLDIAMPIDHATSYEDAVRHLPRHPKAKPSVADLIDLMNELMKRKRHLVGVGEKTSVTSMTDISNQCLDIRDKKKEYLVAFFLNARNQLICKETISIGTLTASLAHPREIFAPAIGKAAAGVILVHNHPSGDPSPSDEDARLTKRISQCGHIMGIELLDHLIVAENGCYSFKQAGQL